MDTPVVSPSSVPGVEDYREASFPVDRNIAIPELPEYQLADILRKIVDIEGPVHQDEIAKRATTLWQLKRTGSKISGAVERALERLFRQGSVQVEEGFYNLAGREAAIRDRSMVVSAGLKRPEYVAPSEIRIALLVAIRSAVGASVEEALQQAARALGLKSAAGLRERAEQAVRGLVREGMLTVEDGKLYLAKEARGAAKSVG
jgi:hypothetical protein